jgi:large subunit ribosomal protein L24
MNKIKKGDEVYILSGKDRGKRGPVLRVLANGRAVVQGVNMVKKHTKPNPQENKPGGILEQEASLEISNIAIYNPATGRGDRVGFRFLEDGRKVRYFKSNGEVVDA